MTVSDADFDPSRKKTERVLGADMAYVEHGSGDPIVLLHGNPTSSYLWRRVIPHLSELGTCIAPDLIGMGDSERVDSGRDAYRFSTHARYLEALLGALGVDENVTLVGHDWGGALLFDWGRKNPGAVRGVAFMETIVTPLTWSDWPEAAVGIFEGMRSEAGEEMVLTKNVFVERVLPSAVLTPIPAEDMAVYRRPYLEPGESRRPTLTWPREIPIDGEPAGMVDVVTASEAWLSRADVPKLFIDADPGSIIGDRVRRLIRSWPNLDDVTVPGLHFVPEDSGDEIGRAVADWMGSLGQPLSPGGTSNLTL
ncbi:MAG TPA: haloalkane dehalogenase [Acidimicrobiia bacterium]|nr:haloalkane dehalogenase [Acidimicrobiia bacterium]